MLSCFILHRASLMYTVCKLNQIWTQSDCRLHTHLLLSLIEIKVKTTSQVTRSRKAASLKMRMANQA